MIAHYLYIFDCMVFIYVYMNIVMKRIKMMIIIII